MKTVFLACAVCGSLNSERISEERPHGDLLEAIVTCRDCAFVYRNPCVEGAGGEATSMPSGNPDLTASEIASRVGLERGDAWLDIGSHDGAFAEALRRKLPDVEMILLEANVGLVERAKQRNPRAAVLPSALWEADLPQAVFRLVTARRVDHFFPHHRRDVERIRTLLKPGGIFYIERSIFVDSVRQNGTGNTWFGREQFAEYLGKVFDVADRIDYTDGAIGVFCRRS